MQPRRMKRLAGPAYYVNVKFNQKMAEDNKSTSGPKRHPDYKHHHDWELFDIKEGEIVVCRSNKVRTRDPPARVISSLNGAVTEETKDKILDNYTFFGIAQTEHKAEKNPQNTNLNQGLVAAVGGIATIINDHTESISPGDLLYLAAPVASVPYRGIPKDKKRFCLKPGPPTNMGFHDEMWSFLTASTTNTTKQEFLEKVKSILKRRRRPVAKALSQAKKGERLDILLHPRLPCKIH